VGLVHRARDLAQVILAGLPERWRHTIGVARRAEEVAPILEFRADREILIAAAWLHDIGYAEELRDSGFPPLDGARYLQRNGWQTRLAGLVAHHSEASSVARVSGLIDAVDAFPQERSLASDALAYADQTVGPNGRSMTFEQRQNDMLDRHPQDSPPVIAHRQREALLQAAINRVEQRLEGSRRPSAEASF
jgi:HD superfamily phosphodiesterase